jgi:hypothetical protein
MSDAFDQEYGEHLRAMVDVLQDAGRLAVGQTSDGAQWILLRPCMRAFRVPQHMQRWLERNCRTTLGWVHGRLVLLIDSWELLQIVPHGDHPICHQVHHWFVQVQLAIMHYGVYDPATGHTPPPGQELDAIERREEFQAQFDDAFPWFKTLPRYRIIVNDDGTRSVEPITQEETDNDDID